MKRRWRMMLMKTTRMKIAHVVYLPVLAVFVGK
jgi:hypothetical protein